MSTSSKKNRLLVSVRTKFWHDQQELSPDQVIKLTGCSASTAYRWIKSPDKVPPGIMELLQIKVFGLIPDPAFNGWKAQDGKLWPALPSYRGLHAQQIEHFGMIYAHVRILKRALSVEERKSRHMARLLEEYRQRTPGALFAANDEDV